MNSIQLSIRLLAPILALLLLGSAACSTLTGGGSPSPVVDRIRSTGQIRIGMTGDYPPLNMLDRRGENFGLEPDIARALAQAMEVELVVVNQPFGELLESLEAGEVDAVMSGMAMVPQRNLRVAFAGPYLVSGKAVLTKSATLSKATSVDDLSSGRLRMTVLAGSTSEAFLGKVAPGADVRPVATYEEAIGLVLQDEVDALFADYPACALAVLRNPRAGLLTVANPLSFEPIGIALPASDPLLVNLVQNYMTILEGTGLLEDLRRRWFEDPSWLAELP